MRFLEIAQNGSMRKAAEFLNISQPALSQSLRELELEIGFQLFERTPRGLSITPEGRQLAVYAKVLSNDMALLKDAVIAIRERRDVSLRIGASASICAGALPAVTTALVDGGFASAVHVHEGTSDVLIPALREGAIDFAVSYLWNPGCSDEALAYEHLGNSTITAICQRHHQDALKKHGVAYLSDQKWVMMVRSTDLKERFENFFSSGEIERPEVVVETDNTTLALRLLSESDYFAFIPLEHTRVLKTRELLALNLRDITWVRGVGLFYRKVSFDWSYIPVVREALKTHYSRDAIGADHGEMPVIRLQTQP
tara:strand:+ start:1040 stop:1972 length:933 start_codon:yes stop_codon:yes gene_type:complete